MIDVFFPTFATATCIRAFFPNHYFWMRTAASNSTCALAPFQLGHAWFVVTGHVPDTIVVLLVALRICVSARPGAAWLFRSLITFTAAGHLNIYCWRSFTSLAALL